MKKGKITRFIPILVWLIISALLLGTWVYVYLSSNEKILIINDIKIQAKSAELMLERRKELESLTGEIIAKKQKIDSIFLKKSTLINFIELLEGISKSTGVTLKINSDDPKGNPIFKLAVEGRYEQVFRFLLLIENAPYKIEVNNITMQKQGGAEKVADFWKADLDLTLLSYEDKI